MSLYKIMVVDDEEEIRLGIIKKIKWQENGFDIIGDAENGREALEKAEKLQPDIIITDIKMPFMDGIELSKNITEIMPNTKIIILTGFDDFEYAKEAIKSNVIEYILKPVNSNEFTDMLKRIKVRLDEEYDNKRNLEKIYKNYNESIPIIREQFLVGAIEGRVSKVEWNNREKSLGINLKLNNFTVVTIYRENGAGFENYKLEVDKDVYLLSIKNILDERLREYCKFISFQYSDTIIAIINIDDRSEILSIIRGINEICNYYERVMDCKITAGIGYIYSDINEIKASYKSSQNALEYRLILGIGKAIYIDDVEPNTSGILKFDDAEERKMLNAIKISGEKEILLEINNIFKKVEKMLLPFNQYRIYLMEVMMAFLRVVQTYEFNIDYVFGSNFNCYSHLESFDSLDDMRIWFINKAIKVNDLIKRERMNSSKLLIEKAKGYINENYWDYELSVEKLSRELHVSPTYFSTIFKKETEMTFVAYLTNVRLEEAVKLLNTTDDKTYIIATKVGYTEANYFSYVFKKQFGISPLKYRKS